MITGCEAGGWAHLSLRGVPRGSHAKQVGGFSS